MKKALYFLKPHKAYNSGEVAGFPSAEASRLMQEGIAMDYDAYKESLEPPKKKPAAKRARKPAAKKKAAKK